MLIVVDLNHLAYRCLFAAKKDIMEVGWQYFKHMLYNNIFSMCKKFEATKVVLAVDSKDNWRKKVYPEYKEHRKENREEAHEEINWNDFFTALQEFVDDVKLYFPFYVLQTKYLEADDIAAIIAKSQQSEQKIIITSDSDYVQLLRYNNCKIYDPMKTNFVKCDDPERALKIKILMGDKGDNITAIKPKIGPGTAAKLVDAPELLTKLFEDVTVAYTKPDGVQVTFGEEYKSKFKRNTILIDFDKIPDVFITKVKSLIEKYELPTGRDIAKYFIINKYRELNRRFEEIDGIISRIKKAQKESLEFNNAFNVL